MGCTEREWLSWLPGAARACADAGAQAGRSGDRPGQAGPYAGRRWRRARSRSCACRGWRCSSASMAASPTPSGSASCAGSTSTRSAAAAIRRRYRVNAAACGRSTTAARGAARAPRRCGRRGSRAGRRAAPASRGLRSSASRAWTLRGCSLSVGRSATRNTVPRRGGTKSNLAPAPPPRCRTASARPLATASAAARCDRFGGTGDGRSPRRRSCAASSSSSTTRVPRRWRDARNRPGRFRSARPAARTGCVWRDHQTCGGARSRSACAGPAGAATGRRARSASAPAHRSGAWNPASEQRQIVQRGQRVDAAAELDVQVQAVLVLRPPGAGAAGHRRDSRRSRPDRRCRQRRWRRRVRAAPRSASICGAESRLRAAFGPEQLFGERREHCRLALDPGHQPWPSSASPALEFAPHVAVRTATGRARRR